MAVGSREEGVVRQEPATERGRSRWNATIQAGAAKAPLFLYIQPARLVFLSIASMGLYEAYWVYKNWRYIKERDGLNISPFWRGVFRIFLLPWSAAPHARRQGRQLIQKPSFAPGGLATVWLILTIVATIMGRVHGMLPNVLTPFIPSYLCLLPVQDYVNEVTEKQNPDLSLPPVVLRARRLPRHRPPGVGICSVRSRSEAKR